VAAPDRAGISVFRGILSLLPARLVSYADYEAVGESSPLACSSGTFSPAHPFTPS